METKSAKCFISTTHDPYLNLAIEDWIFNDLEPNQEILFLWQNDRSVIIGRNQNPHAECNLNKMQESKINLVRRHSGGGAVFQDLGNMNFTFLSSKDNYDKNKNFQIIINALKKFNISTEKSGRNDILVDGKKVSGSAFKEKPDRAFHHGTLMMHVNLEELQNYLTPSPKKLQAKGTTSVRSRVENLKEFNNSISYESLSNAIIQEFFTFHNSEKDIELLDHNKLAQIKELSDYYNLLKSDSWRLGETPEFTHHLEERLSWACLDIHLNVKGNKVETAKVFSDALDTDLIHSLESSFKDISYDKESIKKAINNLKISHSSSKDHLEELENWLVGQI